MKDILKMLFGGDFQAGVYGNGGKVDTKLSIAEVEKIAKATANALGSEFSVTKGSVDNGTFDLDYKGEKYDGGSYLIMDNGDVVNVALRGRPIYYNYKTKKKFEFGGDFQAGVYAEGGSLQAHGIKVGDTFLKTMSGAIQKVKDRNGNIVYINLANGERSLQPPLPFDEGGEVKYYINKDGIKVRSKVEPKTKLSEAEWMAKYNDSKEARTYVFGGLFSKSNIMPKPKPINLNQKQVKLKSGEYVHVIEQDGDSLTVMELSKLGLGTPPKYVKLSDVDMTSLANGGALIGNQKRIDMNKNGKIDAEDFKILRASMNGAWRNERKHVNHNEDYEVRYARKKPSRTGYKGKRKFGEGGALNLDFRNFTLDELINNLPQDVDFMWINKANTKDYVRRYSAEFKKYSNKKFTITDSGKMELSKGSENMYLDIMVFESSYEAPETEYIISIYTKDNQKGLKEFTNNLVQKFAGGGGVGEKYVYKTNNRIFADDLLKYADLQNIKASSKKIGSYYYVTTNKKIEARESMTKELAKIVEGKKFKEGGGISNFERLSRIVAKNYEGKRVKPQYQKEYGKVYSKSEAKEVGNKVAGKVKAMQKAESGAEVKKGNRGGVMVLAKKIRKEGESWKDALKRAGQQLK